MTIRSDNTYEGEAEDEGIDPQLAAVGTETSATAEGDGLASKACDFGTITESGANYISHGPFRMHEGGLFFQEQGSSPFKIANPIEVLAQTRSADGDNWGLLLRWNDDDHRTHRWAMPKSLLAGDGAELCRTLLDQGLSITPSYQSKQRLCAYLAEVVTPWRARAVRRIGWHDRCFVLPHRTLGERDERILLQADKQSANVFRQSGSLHEWSREVAHFAAGNSRLAFAISAALAAPLLHLTGAESGGFHLRGPSSIGKSTLLHAAGSVWGGGGVKGYLQQWRATDNGLEAVAEAHCDVLLCLDELSQSEAKDAGAIAYMLANGSGKSRASKDGGARRAAEWRSLFLSSGETGLAEKLSEDGSGKRQAAGQTVRIVDIEADAGKGLGIVEHLHEFTSSGDLVRHLQEASTRQFGTAGVAFVEGLLLLPDLPDTISGFRTDFVEEACPKDADGQVRRVCERFGLVAAAGELAIALAIVPWAKGTAVEAAKSCLESWLRSRGTNGPQEIADAIGQIRLFIEQHGDARFASWSEGLSSDTDRQRTINRAGFRKADGIGGYDYYVLPQVWKAEVCKGLDPKFIARELAAKGILVKDHGKNQVAIKPPGFAKTIRAYHLTSRLFDEQDDSDA